jgi:RNA polymerase sigma factor (sigma-70 family)
MKEWAATGMANDSPQADDRELVAACVQGDVVAWEALLARYQRLIYSIPIKMGLSPNDAADIFQSVCVKLLRSLSTLRDQGKISAWLTVTTRRECWHLAALRRREQVVVPYDIGDGAERAVEAAADGLPPDEQLQRLEQQQILRDAVAALPEHCRQLLTMLFYDNDELSYVEIARRLNMPRASIGPTRARCLVRLRKVLKGKI